MQFESFFDAGVAQLVEQLICNQQVGGSTPFASSSVGDAGRGADDLSSPPWNLRTGGGVVKRTRL